MSFLAKKTHDYGSRRLTHQGRDRCSRGVGASGCKSELHASEEVVAKAPEKKGTTNVHDDGSSPSVMKVLATQSLRHRGKAFFLFSLSLRLRGNFLSRQRHNVISVLV